MVVGLSKHNVFECFKAPIHVLWWECGDMDKAYCVAVGFSFFYLGAVYVCAVCAGAPVYRPHPGKTIPARRQLKLVYLFIYFPSKK